jgi:aminoglycoside phosphotransferase (APT) family kinase protein
MTAGIDAGPVTAWIVEHAPDITPPLEFEVIEGGHSNITYRVADPAGARLVLRRPPLGHVLESAHDMGREHRIISALGPTDVPVPSVVGLCTDPSVNGSDFYVMRFVEGQVLRTTADASRLPREARSRLSGRLVDGLVAIHAVDLEATGLADLGRTEDYVARQLRRWHRQFHEGGTREMPLLDTVHDALSERIPPQVGATLVHGDYRLDNCLVTEDGDLAAVLDWEICTLGDPLADLGFLLTYWLEPDDAVNPLGHTATATDGFWDRRRIVERYGELSGRDISDMDVYVAFGRWRLACILEGVYARYVGGAKGEPPPDVEFFAERVGLLVEQAARDLGLS